MHKAERTRLRLGVSGLGLWVLCGCSQQQRVPSVTIEPPANNEAAVEPAVAPGDDFVLSRQPPAARPQQAQLAIHVGDRWWKFRAEFLNLGEAEVRERDAGISDRQPPMDFWDRQTSVEAVSVWSVLCNECHGGRRKIEDAVRMPSPAPQWGRGEGLFFGNRRRYSDLFATVTNGGPKREDGRPAMPSWKGKLAKEQMWALLYFLEYQSGGIEGRFPPSLYPRMSTVPE